MAYQQYGQGGSGGYQQRNQGGYQQGGGNQYNRTPYTPPQKKEFSLEDRSAQYAITYLTLKEVLETNNVSIDEVKDFMGGWTTSLMISQDKS
jgi:hypothetical protein